MKLNHTLHAVFASPPNHARERISYGKNFGELYPPKDEIVEVPFLEVFGIYLRLILRYFNTC